VFDEKSGKCATKSGLYQNPIELEKSYLGLDCKYYSECKSDSPKLSRHARHDTDLGCRLGLQENSWWPKIILRPFTVIGILEFAILV